MVGAGDPPAQGHVELGQGQPRCGRRVAADQVPGQLGQQPGGHRAHEPFHLAAALGRATVEWTIWMCRSAATVVMWSLVKSLPWSTYRRLGKPCTGPGRVALASDRLAQREGQVQRRGRPEEDAVPGDRSGADRKSTRLN